MPIAIVPARGGSKRIHRKNIKPFLGKPILARVLDELHASKIFSHVVVSTDDKEIAELSKISGADLIIERPANLADDHTGIKEVVAHAINHRALESLDVNEVVCIFPTSIFVTSDILASSLNEFRKTSEFSMVSVLEFPHPIQRALVREKDGYLTLKHPEYITSRTQDLEKNYYDAAQFYWAKKERWLSADSILHKSKPFILAGWEAVDIDTDADWMFAEKLFSLSEKQTSYFSNNQ